MKKEIISFLKTAFLSMEFTLFQYLTIPKIAKNLTKIVIYNFRAKIFSPGNTKKLLLPLYEFSYFWLINV